MAALCKAEVSTTLHSTASKAQTQLNLERSNIHCKTIFRAQQMSSVPTRNIKRMHRECFSWDVMCLSKAAITQSCSLPPTPASQVFPYPSPTASACSFFSLFLWIWDSHSSYYYMHDLKFCY